MMGSSFFFGIWVMNEVLGSTPANELSDLRYPRSKLSFLRRMTVTWTKICGEHLLGIFSLLSALVAKKNRLRSAFIPKESGQVPRNLRAKSSESSTTSACKNQITPTKVCKPITVATKKTYLYIKKK